MNKSIIFFIVFFTFSQSQAQLLNEIGLSVGGTNYSGDIGNELFILPNKIGWSIIYKRNLDSRVSYRASFSHMPISGDDKYSFNKARKDRGYNFKNVVDELAFGLEFNYFDYDVLSFNKGHTPYIFIEIAGFYYNYARTHDIISNAIITNKKFSYAIPFGAGYKSRITDHLGFALELRASYTFEDDLDNSPILDIGNPKTKDWYFFTGVSLTYSFGRPPCYTVRPF